MFASYQGNPLKPKCTLLVISCQLWCFIFQDLGDFQCRSCMCEYGLFMRHVLWSWNIAHWYVKHHKQPKEGIIYFRKMNGNFCLFWHPCILYVPGQFMQDLINKINVIFTLKIHNPDPNFDSSIQTFITRLHKVWFNQTLTMAVIHQS